MKSKTSFLSVFFVLALGLLLVGCTQGQALGKGRGGFQPPIFNASYATLVVNSSVFGANVTNLDTRAFYCVTPCRVRIPVPPNSINISVSHAGYYDWTNRGYLYAGQTTAVYAQLLPVATPPAGYATLVVNSSVFGANVTNLDTRAFYCVTPCRVRIPVPPNSINIRVSHAGYYDWTNLVYVYASQSTYVYAQLLPTPTPMPTPANVTLLHSYIEDNLDNQAESVRDTTTWFASGWNKNGSQLSYTGSPRLLTGGDSAYLAQNVPVTGVRGLNVRETENVAVFSTTRYYAPFAGVVSQGPRAQYRATFTDPLPYCLDTTKGFSNCPVGNRTDQNRVVLKFLGGDWVVTQLNGANNSITTLQLGFENAYSPTMNVGDTLTASDGTTFRLIDITPTGNLSNASTASFEIHPYGGTTSVQTIPEGSIYRDSASGKYVHLRKIFPGVGGTYYAEVSIYGDVVTLIDGQQIPGYGYWRATLAQTLLASSPAIGALGVSDLTQGSTVLNPGDSLCLITNYCALRLTYNGTDPLATYDSLSLQADPDYVTLATDQGMLTGKFVTFTSAYSNAFQFSAPEVINTNLVKILATNVTGNASFAPGDIFALGTASGLWRRVLTAADVSTSGNGLPYNFFPGYRAAAIKAPVVGDGLLILLPERAVDSATTAYNVTLGDGYSGEWATRYSAGYGQFVDPIQGSLTGHYADYQYPSTNSVTLNGTLQNAPYISYGGTKLPSTGPAGIGFYYPQGVVHAIHLFGK